MQGPGFKPRPPQKNKNKPFYKILSKNIKSTYEFALKERPKVKMETIWGLKVEEIYSHI